MSKFVREVDSIDGLRNTPTSDAAAAHVRTPTAQSGVFVPMDADPFGNGDDGAVALQASDGRWWVRSKAKDGNPFQPEWWGADQLTSGDDEPALRSAITAKSRGFVDLASTDLSSDAYRVQSDVVLTDRVIMRGQNWFGSQILWDTAETPIDAVVRHKKSDATGDFSFATGLQDLKVDGAGNADVGVRMEGLNEGSKIEDLVISKTTSVACEILRGRGGGNPWTQNVEIGPVLALPSGGDGFHIEARKATFQQVSADPQGGSEDKAEHAIEVIEGGELQFRSCGGEDFDVSFRIGAQNKINKFALYQCDHQSNARSSLDERELLDFKLKQNITDTNTTFDVSNDFEGNFSAAEAFDLPGAPFTVEIGNERMEVLSVNRSGGEITVDRGVDGTTAASHDSGDTITVVGTVAIFVGNKDQQTGGATGYTIMDFFAGAEPDYILFDPVNHLYVPGRGQGTSSPLEISFLAANGGNMILQTGTSGTEIYTGGAGAGIPSLRFQGGRDNLGALEPPIEISFFNGAEFTAPRQVGIGQSDSGDTGNRVLQVPN